MPRYIDADALKNRMLNYYDCVNENTDKSNYRGETLMNYEVADMIEDCIDNAPTADVVERKRGEWRFVGNANGGSVGGTLYYKCPFCGYEITQARMGEANFCEWCGADMRGKEE